MLVHVRRNELLSRTLQDCIDASARGAVSGSEEALGDLFGNGLPPPPFHYRTNGTGRIEWFTPAEYVEAARDVLGGIDLDPASNDIANETVRAEQYFTKRENGLVREWRGRIWLNPPYSHPVLGRFVVKLLREIDIGRVSSAILLTNALTDTRWFHTAARASEAICFTRRRIRFLAPDGTLAQPVQGQAFFYFGDDRLGFCRLFQNIGAVMPVAVRSLSLPLFDEPIEPQDMQP
jgi:phage N-6-adenine-methyltransferase